MSASTQHRAPKSKWGSFLANFRSFKQNLRVCDGSVGRASENFRAFCLKTAYVIIFKFQGVQVQMNPPFLDVIFGENIHCMKQ